MSKKIALPENEILLYILSAATAVTVAWALIYIDGGQTDIIGQGLVVVRGLLLGVASGFATAIVSHRAQRVKAKEAKQWAVGSLAAMLAAELVVVSFVTYATMNPAMLVMWWPLRALISFAAGAFIPAVSIGIASVSGGLQAETQSSAEVSQPTEKPAKAQKAEHVIAQILEPEPQPVPVVTQVVSPAFSDENLIAQYILNPVATNAALAKVFGVSAQAVSQRRITLEQHGRIRKVEKEVRVIPEFVEVK